MALLHQAEIKPTKLELLEAWLPTRPWFDGPATALERVAACRFDDPDGEVGIETFLVRSGNGPIYHVPLTYRGAPLEGGEHSLAGTMDHSVLGERWVYDACGDPVYVQALTAAIVGGGTEAAEFVDVDGQNVARKPAMTLKGSGQQGTNVPVIGAILRLVQDDPTLIVTHTVELAVLRRIGGTEELAGATLTGQWDGQATPVTLAYAALR